MANKESYLGEFENIVLLAVLRLGKNAYGMKIRQEIETRVKRDVSLGALYATLERLEKKTYVQSKTGEPTPQRGGRAKRYFKVSASGIRALQDTKNNLEAMWQGIDFSLSPIHLLIVKGNKLDSRDLLFQSRILTQRMIMTSLLLGMFGMALEISAEPNLENGKRLYKKHCLMCHGLKGEGRFGPNLTDNYWLYGNTTADITKVVTEGVTDNGMVRWGKKLPQAAIDDVVAYVESLKGSNPLNAKAPQGLEYPE